MTRWRNLLRSSRMESRRLGGPTGKTGEKTVFSLVIRLSVGSRVPRDRMESRRLGGPTGKTGILPVLLGQRASRPLRICGGTDPSVGGARSCATTIRPLCSKGALALAAKPRRLRPCSKAEAALLRRHCTRSYFPVVNVAVSAAQLVALGVCPHKAPLAQLPWHHPDKIMFRLSADWIT